jgi:UDP-glucuronate decarboxylase
MDNKQYQEIHEDLEDIIGVLEGKTLLITGASGFLGVWFAGFLNFLNEHKVTDKIRIICVDNNISGDSQKLNHFKTVEVYEMDIIDGFLKELPFEGSVDYIINAAGIASPRVYQRYPVETMDVSYIGTKNILNFALENQVESVLCFSSSEVYGTPDELHIPTTEDYLGSVPTMSNRSCYDIGKKIIETVSYVYFKKHNIPVKVVRPFNVYGPNMYENDHRVLSNSIARILKDEPITIYGDGEQSRTFCYITDAIKGFMRVLLKGRSGEVYNIGNSNPETSMIDFASILYKVANKSNISKLIPYPPYYPDDEPRRRCPDISKATEELGYTPTVELEVGFKRMYEWAKDNYFMEGQNDTTV